MIRLFLAIHTKAARPCLAIAVAVGLALASPSICLAQQAKPDAQRREKANRHFKNGVDLYDEGKYAEALAEFEAAYTLAPHPLVLYNLAGCHRALSQYDQAVTYYDRFLESAPGRVKENLIEAGRKERDSVLALIALVVVTTNPVGASVTVDGRQFGPTPLESPLILGPGDHVISAEQEGRKSARRSVRVAAGDSLRVELTLPEQSTDSAPPDRGTGSVTDITAQPPATVTTAAPVATPRAKTLGVSASIVTNARHMADTGAPAIGVHYAVADRVSIGLDVLFVAFAAVPQARVRLAGDALSLHAVAAVPIAFTDGDDSETFTAIAGGLGLAYQASAAVSLRLETWLSYAGGDRGTTLPTMAGAALWF